MKTVTYKVNLEASTPVIIIASDDFPNGQHIEVKFSDDGAVIVEAWCEGCGEFQNSNVILFDDILDYEEEGD